MRPTKKVTAGALTGALTVIALAVLNYFGIELPPEVSGAITGVLTSGAAYMKTEEFGE